MKCHLNNSIWSYFLVLTLNLIYVIPEGLFDPDIVISNEHNISEVSSVAKVTNSETGKNSISRFMIPK